MTRLIHGVPVHGLDLGPRSECQHWHSHKDIVALQFPCCDEFYACADCHASLADHPSQVWPKSSFDTTKAILCGACGHLLTITEYLQADDACPNCQAPFNPGCRLHRHLYFETDGD